MDAHILGFCHFLPLRSMFLKDEEKPTGMVFRLQFMHLAASFPISAEACRTHGTVLGSQSLLPRITTSNLHQAG